MKGEAARAALIDTLVQLGAQADAVGPPWSDIRGQFKVEVPLSLLDEIAAVLTDIDRPAKKGRPPAESRLAELARRGANFVQQGIGLEQVLEKAAEGLTKEEAKTLRAMTNRELLKRGVAVADRTAKSRRPRHPDSGFVPPDDESN